MQADHLFALDQPTTDKLKQLLRDVHVGDNAVQKRVSQDLGKISDHPDFPLYCCAILADEKNSDIALRYTAGVCLKSVLGRSQSPMDAGRQEMAEQCFMQCAVADNELIRKAGKLNLVTMVSRKGIVQSEAILSFFVQCINSGKEALIADALDCLAQVFQDINFNFENLQEPEKVFGSPFVTELIAKLASLITASNPTLIRLPSFECLTNLLVSCPPELIARTSSLVKSMLIMLDESEPKVRQRVYAYLLGLCQVRKDLFVSESDSIFPKLAACLGDSDKLACRACFMIFWEFLSVHEDEEAAQVIQLLLPHLETIVPHLMHNAVLTDEDRENLVSSVAQCIQKNQVYEKAMQADAGEEGEFDIAGEDEDEDDDANGAYTTRKLALRCLVKIFEFLGNPAFAFVKDRLDVMMQSEDWLQREAAFCVIGSIGDYCFEELRPTIGKILDFILKTAVNSHNQFIKSTGIWAIRKYRDHLLQDTSEQTKGFLLQYLDLLLVTIQGQSLVAQDSAASALKKLCQSKAEMIFELSDKLIELFASILAQPTYHKVFIYDTLAEFIESLPDAEHRVPVLRTVMPLLVQDFRTIGVQEGAFVSLFECLNTIQRIAGMETLPWLEVMLERIVFLGREIGAHLNAGSQLRQKSKERVQLEFELNDNLMRCLDFVGGVADSTEGAFASLPISEKLPELAFSNLRSDNVFLRQVVFSVIGDLVAYLPSRLFEPHFAACVDILIENCQVLPESMDPGKSYLSVATNALYALSKLIIKFPARVPAEAVLAKLSIIYKQPKLHKYLTINCSIAFGSLGLHSAEAVSRHLEQCLKKVCFGFICSKEDDGGVNDAMVGLNKAIVKNPQALLTHLSFYLEAVGKFKQATPEVDNSCRAILEELAKGDESVKKKVRQALEDLSKDARAGLGQRFGFGIN